MWRKKKSLNLDGLARHQSTEEGIQNGLTSHKLRIVEPIQRTHSGSRGGEEASTSGRDWQVNAPLDLNIGCVKGGSPDLQFRLFQLSTGCLSSHCTESPGAFQSAAALLFLRVIFPDQMGHLQKPLVGLGVSAGATKLLAGAWQNRDSLGRARWLLRSRSLSTRTRSQQEGRRGRRPVFGSKAVSQVWRGASEKASSFGKSAAGLAVLALLWRNAHFTSYQLGQAILVAINLSSGYNETKQQAASGKISSGPQLEAAWRARHKWAAQRASRVMVDVYDSPPLRPFMTAAQKLSIGFVMLMSASPSGPLVHETPSGSGFSRTSYTPGGMSTFVASYPGGCRKKHVQEAEKSKEEESDWKLQQDQSSPPIGSAENGVLAGNYEPLEGYKPSEMEDLSTGELPTITCFEDLKNYKQALAKMSRRKSPVDSNDDTSNRQINIAANATGSQSVQPPGRPVGIPDEVVLFTTEELKAMDPGMRQNIDYSEDDSAEPKLALYGRADHTPKQPLTLLDKQSMAVRAAFLVMFFLPFLVMGPLLLTLSNRFQKAQQPAPKPQEARAPQIGEILGDAEPSTEEKPVAETSRVRSAAWHLLLWGIRNSGAAFIKWGQWSATREDMFPAEFCSILSELHDAAPVHSWKESKAEIERSFGKTVEELFESIDHEPLASGSIAQVHKAIMVIGGKRRSVVVKVRHPGVEVRIRQDFEILKPLAAAASKVKSLKGLSLKESLAQFSSTMTAQTDLRVEAAHLIRFFRNFAPVRGSVTPPFPLPDYITEAVLIETYEPGQSVAKYIKNPAPFNTQVVALGVDTYLKMLLEDNFVHTDLHPGNILVRRGDGGELSRDVAADDVRGKLQLILLDFGLAEELNPTVRKHFISFLHMIAAGNGRRAAYHILKWSSNQTCPDPEGFTEAMVKMFSIEAQIQTEAGIELDKVMKEVLRIARQFEVNIDSSYAALVIGVVVLVGFATSMDPGVNLMDAAAPAFLQNNLLGKVSGRLYS